MSATISDEVLQQLTTIAKAIADEADLIARTSQQLLADVQHFGQTLSGMDSYGGVTIYNQRDPRWANVRMGSSVGAIGAVGCLITSVASMLSDAGKILTPDMLNTWLTQNGGFVSGNLFVYNSIDKLGAVKFSTRIDCPLTAAPMAQLDAEINGSNFVIVKVNNGLPPDYHWVRYLGKGEMVDPWYGDVTTITPRYKGANAAECIRAAIIYKRIGL